MTSENPHSTVAVAGHPLHPMLVPFPIVCFVLTLVFDIAYARTAQMQWANFSAWLLVIGLILAALAALAGVIDFFGDRRIRALPAVWIHGIGNAIAVILSIWNAFVHSRDAYTSVVPTGLTLSVIVVLILLVTGWMGWEMVYRHRVGVRAEADQ
jgi:uncharacterized membrane protein